MLAAVCAATGAMSAVILPTLNTEVVNLFLEQFSRELPAGVHAVLIDGAASTPVSVVVPSNVSLIQLPPYSPELNPVENLWHYCVPSLVEPPVPDTTRCRRRRSGVCVRSAKTQKRSRPSAILHISQGRMKLPESVSPGKEDRSSTKKTRHGFKNRA